MMNKEVDVVKYLLENKYDANISNISSGMDIDYKNAHNIINRLIEKSIVKAVAFGKSIKINLINSPNHLIYEAETKRKKEILKNKNLSLILDYFENNMESKFYIMLLFGSYAKKIEKKNSDIDLLFIVPNEVIEKNINRIVSMIPLKIHANIFTEKEFMEMKNSKKRTVGSEAIDSNIIMHGIEIYYRLLNDL